MYSEAGGTGQSATQSIIDLIAMGICEDGVIDNYVSAMARDVNQDERHSAVRQIADIARTSKDMRTVARALKSLTFLLPLEHDVENEIDERLLALIDRGAMAKNAELAEAIALFIYTRSQARVNVAEPYVPALIPLLAQNVSTTGAYAYYTLVIVANSASHYFESCAHMLVEMLDSPSHTAKAFAMRLIAALALHHPEYVADARDTLYNLSRTSTHEIIKAEATKAYRAVNHTPKALRGSKGTQRDDPAIPSLYDMPVWQRAVQNHLSADSSRAVTPAGRPRPGRPDARGEIRPSKRHNRNQESVRKPVPGERNQSREVQIAPVEPEAIVSGVSPGIKVDLAPASNPLPVAEISYPATEVPDVVAPASEDSPPDLAGVSSLHKMMDDVQIEFSAQAGELLDALGMGHLKRGGAITTEDGSHRISGKEFVAALEKLVKQHNGKVL